MKAGIVIDDWKLAIFSRHLTGAGFAFVNKGSPVPTVLLLEVEVEYAAEAAKLTDTLAAATAEAASIGEPNQ